MADRIPIKAKYAPGSPTDVIALQEFEPTDTISLNLISDFSAGVTAELALNSITTLSDVNTLGSPAPIDGDVLTWNASMGYWEPLNPIDNAVPPAWGNITGTLSDQLDLQSALAAKADVVHAHIMADITDSTWISDITAATLSQLSDVTETAATTGDILWWSGIAWVNYSDSNYEPANTNIQVHITDTTIHFAEASIDHGNILNIGTNTHVQIDMHVLGTAYQHPATVITFDDTIVNQGFTQVQETLDYFDNQIRLRETASTAIDLGGNITIATSTTVDITAGEGHVIDGYTDRHNPTRSAVNWNAVNGYVIIFPTTIGVQVVYVDQTGTIQQKTGRLTEQERRSVIQLAFVYHKDGIIKTVQPAGIFLNEAGGILYDWIYFTEQSNRVKGMGINPVDNLLQIWGESGEFISPGINTTNDLKNPNIGLFPADGDNLTSFSFDVLFASGITQALAQTTIPKYYESAPGVTMALSGNDAAIHYVYRTFSNEFVLQLGTTVYSDAKLARDSLEIDRNTFTQFTGSDNTLPSAQIYLAANASDFNDQNQAGIVSLIGAGAGASGGVAVTTFIDLTDTIDTSYVGKAGYVVTVDNSGTGLIFTPRQATWGSLTGTLSDQTDLQTELDAKPNLAGKNFFTSIAGSPIDAADQWYLGGSIHIATEGTASEIGVLSENTNNELEIYGDLGISLNSAAVLLPNFTGFDGAYLTLGTDGLITATTPVDPIVAQSDNNPGSVSVPVTTPTDLGVSITKNGTSVRPTLEIAMSVDNFNSCSQGASPANLQFYLYINGVDATTTPLADEVPCNTTNILVHAALPYSGTINDTDVVTVRVVTDDPITISNITFKISVSGSSTTAAWGALTGTLSTQTDLQLVLDTKANQTGLDAHTSDSIIHFTESSIDHLNVLNVGTNTHAQIDTHIADNTIHGYQPLIINIQTGVAYTLELTDAGNMVEMNNTGANTLTVPANTVIAFSVGTEIVISQAGTGQTTVGAAAGVTINSADGLLSLTSQYSGVTLIKKATDTWLLFGDIT